MKQSTVRLMALSLAALASAPRALVSSAPGTADPAGRAVVVELFTSEGCSSCPPADQLLLELRREPSADGTEVISLGFHVDYWDSQGWRDRFSSATYTRRQEQYVRRFRLSGPYTPEMIVDGSEEFVGNDARRARAAIARAAARPQQATVQIESATPDALRIRVKAPAAVSGDVLLAIAEDNLESRVRAGENEGRVLRHSAVVRDLRVLGTLQHGGFAASVPLNLDGTWKRTSLRFVVFVQEASAGRIIGAAGR